ncbi:[FeFe] hydrogenase H-cluster maturation GTPase HydF [Thermodesulfitimonas autotrophica]|uniref:[FeFe] hydrogenase H-cluster maturation GTPase HydF n=1 Tax=Thermodesulfitimonas autotrophica TaxID=1894989 RepID=UPI001475F3C0|nr:[FeFe] hydrogenase H-cluster maturation GTPase HydF [Thermodesulfitimonas autotrophica]
MNATPRGQRLHIALFGRRNAGKSSLINALTGQETAIVADVPGTTTDPVSKAMEILPLGPVMLIDTAGLDDVGYLGDLRVKRSLAVLEKTDLVVLVVDPGQGTGSFEADVLSRSQARGIPVIGVANKCDLYPDPPVGAWAAALPVPWVVVSARTGQGIDRLKRALVEHAPKDWTLPTIVGDLIAPGDTVVLVIPIDKAAPKGRLILPQQQVIRDVLEHDAVAVMVKERELRHALAGMTRPPRLVVTDASAYLKAAADTPPDVLFTSFSILFARFKGDLNTLVAGAKAVDGLRPGDKVLIAEACTHHPIEDDIGRVKIPRWLRQVAGGELVFDVVAGGGPLPDNLAAYRLIVHCGGCMLNRREMLSRLMQAREAGVPVVNYGVLMAHMHGVLRRALSPFPAALAVLGEDPEGLGEEIWPCHLAKYIPQ